MDTAGRPLPRNKGISRSKEALNVTCLDIARPFCLILIIPVWLLAASIAVLAQEPGSPSLPVPVDPGAIAPSTGPALTSPAIPGVPETPPTWTQQRTTMSHAGTVRNTHRQMNSEDGSQQLRQHVVTNPRGEMTQTWEQSEADDGFLYQRSHTFNAPDGTPLRQHEWSRAGTDPNNYTRQREVQLRDGRTILHSQTRSWDGVTGTMEKTFQGPNGQTRQIERPWAPDAEAFAEPGTTIAGPAPAELPALPPPPTVAGGGAAAGPEAKPEKRKAWGWLEKLNPFRRNRSPQGATSGQSSSPRGSGFTLGSGGRGRMGHVPPGLSKKQPGQPSPNSHRPAWAGHPSSPQAASPPAHGRGRNR